MEALDRHVSQSSLVTAVSAVYSSGIQEVPSQSRAVLILPKAALTTNPTRHLSPRAANRKASTDILNSDTWLFINECELRSMQFQPGIKAARLKRIITDHSSYSIQLPNFVNIKGHFCCTSSGRTVVKSGHDLVPTHSKGHSLRRYRRDGTIESHVHDAHVDILG